MDVGLNEQQGLAGTRAGEQCEEIDALVGLECTQLVQHASLYVNTKHMETQRDI